jgi:hypothetical protein
MWFSTYVGEFSLKDIWFYAFALAYAVLVLLPCWLAGSSAYVSQADDSGFEHPNPTA